MDLREAWTLYCEQKFPDPENLPPLDPLSPRETAMLLFENSFLFAARHDRITATPYDKVFDEEADGSLIWLAQFDNFELWDKMSAGGWRVMYERYVYAQVVAMANAAAKEPVMTRIPRGLDPQSQARTVLLQLLLGGARTIDPRLLERHRHQGIPGPDAFQPIRKN